MDMAGLGMWDALIGDVINWKYIPNLIIYNRRSKTKNIGDLQSGSLRDVEAF